MQHEHWVESVTSLLRDLLMKPLPGALSDCVALIKIDLNAFTAMSARRSEHFRRNSKILD